jgi:mono/diheme cytochrome c family protein
MKPTLVLLAALVLAACGGSDAPDAPDTAAPSPASPNVELPVESVELGPFDAALAAEGQQIFETRCTTCHKMEGRYVGPPLGDTFGQREPEHIMNMILAPEKMLQTDPIAQELLAEYNIPMTNQNLTEDEARAILEYLRQVHEGA